MMNAKSENEIGSEVLNACILVHRRMGPGLLESVYEVCLSHALLQRGLSVERQVPIPIAFESIRFEEGFRADMVVEGRVLLELKSVERITPSHRKQVQTYLKLAGLRLGYLLNFGQFLMREGIVRCVNGLEDDEARIKPTVVG